MNEVDKMKQSFWRQLYKVFPKIQGALLKWGIIWHEKKRQEYHIGWVAPHVTLVALKQHLREKWAFGNHFVAWDDPDQVLSWRRLENFNEQYHLRVFSDGEIRGHFELTPEAHPIDHFEEKGEEPRKEEFLKFLGDFAVQEKYISHLVRDPHAKDPDSEIVYQNKV